MKKIILNVDDFGLTAGVNQAVFNLHEQGLVNSTTALVNSPYFHQGIIESKNYPNLGVGIHLTIDLFTAERFHPSLCDEQQNFHKAKTHDLTRSLDSEVVYQEWKAQIEKFIEISGVKPTHIDSHHHAHILNYDARLATERLTNEYHIPVREFTTNKYRAKCAGEFYGDGATFEQLVESINLLLAEEIDYRDIMMHPAVVDDELMAISSYNTQRSNEFEIISSNQFKDFIATNNITITSYR